MRHILFAAAESAPFIKTGGLGSVIGSLPPALCREGLKVSVVIPGYACIPPEHREKMNPLFSFPVKLGWRESMADLASCSHEGVDYYFICNELYFSGDQPYSDIWLDMEKFAFFSRALLEMLNYLELPVDIIHCHDWQTALVPVFLRTMYDHDPYFRKMKTILTIHNMKFQGIGSIGHMKDITGLPDQVFVYDKMENYGQANMLKGGIAYADRITTVSETYAGEIMTPEFGEGLFQILSFRREDLSGITNGIDWSFYNPAADPDLASPYDQTSFLIKRPADKAALQKKTGLAEDPAAFTMGIVSRLTEQKGYDLLDGILEEFLDRGAQLYVLGEGQEEVEDIFNRYCLAYPRQVYVETAYQDKIAKWIYGGCDLTLMPSRFEPCGLNQMMAQRYGCLPLVRATGGLKDTVKDDGALSPHGTGFSFGRYEKEDFKRCLNRAFTLYREYPEDWNARIRAAMEEDFSWEHSARSYKKLYNSL